MSRNKAINTFLIRLLIIFLIHLIIKAGDYSFGEFFGLTFRGLIFSAYFISYWLLLWYIAAFFHRKIQAKKGQSLSSKQGFTSLLFIFHLGYGVAAAFTTNWLYRLGDIALFDNRHLWSDIPLFNPELTVSLFTLYMMIFFFDTYFHVNIKIKENQLQLEKLKQENTLAQYLNLKSQIEPHFLFNTLSVLSAVIHTDADLASELTLRLSRILRYVIEKNKFLLVPLKEEIQFIENYLFLIKARFEEGIIIENTIDKKIIESSYLPPVSLQLLVENAIKHNKFTKDEPLRIQLYNEGGLLTVSNNTDIRNDVESSTKQGLENLSKRYSHFSEMAVAVESNGDTFKVSLPILTKEDYERFNI